MYYYFNGSNNNEYNNKNIYFNNPNNFILSNNVYNNNINNRLNNNANMNNIYNKNNIVNSNLNLINNNIKNNFNNNNSNFNNHNYFNANMNMQNFINGNLINDLNNINLNYEEEKKLRDHGKSINLKELKTISNQMEKCVCKINKNGEQGSGFFCKVRINENKFLPFLITNNHIIDLEDIKTHKTINISINDDKLSREININESRITYTMKKPFDITFIEIKEIDNINSESYLEIDDFIFNESSIDKYQQKPIYLIHYPNQNVEFSTGIIQSISIDDSNSIHHFCETQYGSSGSPIINLENFKVLGIHKGAGDKNFNLGTFLKNPIKKLKEIVDMKNQLENKNNEIIKYDTFNTLGKMTIPTLSKNNMKIISQQMEKCVCKLLTKDLQGTGFFCYIPFFDTKIPVLLTCNHVLNEKCLVDNEKITFYINEKQIINEITIDSSRKTYTNEKYDITIIEIKNNDKINSDSFLNVDENIFGEEETFFYHLAVYSIMYNPDLNTCVGAIQEIEDYRIKYYSTTGGGSSGSPIINLSNYKVIGIHKGRGEFHRYKLGVLIKYAIIEFANKYLI